MSSSWNCARCQVGVSYLPGFDAPEQPAGWEQVAGGWLCLSCRRSAAVEAALAAAGIDVTDRRAGRMKRDALVRFELLRDPGVRGAEVARVAGCPPRDVAHLRRTLVAAGELPEPVEQRCPSCGAAFVPTSSKRRFCSKKCASAARWKAKKAAGEPRRDSSRTAARRST